jgi:hypothetical protein
MARNGSESIHQALECDDDKLDDDKKSVKAWVADQHDMMMVLTSDVVSP